MADKYKVMREGLQTITSLLKYDTVIDEAGVIIKDCGDYLQMICPIKNSAKGYNTYDIFLDGRDHIKEVYSHKTNTGPTGRIYP